MAWDYLIVGAGSAGCALAHELAKSGGKILILEAGVSDESFRIRLPAALLSAIAHFDWGYKSAPDPTRNDKVEPWFRGRVVGGSSSINGMIYVRGNADDYDRWSKIGNLGWDSHSVMPIFKEFERCERRSIKDADTLRGREGRLHVRMVRECHPVTEAFIASAQSVGYLFNPDYNGLRQDGVAYTQLTQRRGRRWSAADAFLKPILARDNVRLLTSASVRKVLIKDGCAYGVRYQHGEAVREARANTVILCGGAINTPKLLMLSGIGDPEALASYGIELIAARRDVGENLMEHPQVRMTYRSRVPTYNLTEGLWQRTRLLAKYLAKGQGLLASTFEAMVFVRTSKSETAPDVQLHFGPVGVGLRDGGNSFSMLPYPSVYVSVKANYPYSRGRVLLASADPDDPPIIEPRMFESERDIDTLARGVETVRRIMAAEPMASLVSEEVTPGAQFGGKIDLENHIRSCAVAASHPIGTCRMGCDTEAVVTPELQVRGVENLWVGDASVMPRHISGNTNAACMMIGAKLGKHLTMQLK